MIFAVPAEMINCCVEYVVPVIITFIALNVIAIRVGDNKAITYNLLMHILFIAIYIVDKIYRVSMADNTALGGLSDVVNCAVITSVLTMFATIFLVLYIKAVSTNKKKNNIDVDEQILKYDMKNYCIRCGTFNEDKDTVCRNCGNRIRNH